VVNIHTELVAYRDAGHAVLLVSAELSEILGLADRVLVMYEGRVVAELNRDEADATTIGLAMAGVEGGLRPPDIQRTDEHRQFRTPGGDAS
jgi:simple sugar transport system ATP-binding protein